jgi:REP element-mobilizing transposase RayT
MTAPRQVVPGKSYLVTRRCSERRFFLRPSQRVNEIFLYVLAVAAERFGIRVHVLCVLSNHFHLVVTDPQARLPAFHQFLDALVARAVNASLGRWETFWAPDSYSAVTLAAPEDIVDKAAYVLANPVAAGLVTSGRDWPGLWSAPEQVGGDVLEVKRPQHFFDPKGSLPEVARLRLVPPPGFSSAEAFREALVAALEGKEAEARRNARSAFLGVARVLAQRPSGRPVSNERRRVLNPRVAALDKWKRVEVLGRLKEFVHAYRAAWRARRDGNKEAVFPFGTYLLRVLHDVPCAAFG